MRELLIIVEREFRERVQTRAFLIGTLLFPVFMIAIMLLPAVMGGSGEQRRIAVVDRAPEGLADIFVQALRASGSASASAPGEEGAARQQEGPGEEAAARQQEAPGEEATQYQYQYDPQSSAPYQVDLLGPDTDLAELNQQVLTGALDGYVLLPETMAETGQVLYRARTITNRIVLRDVRVAATAAVQSRRLGAAGVDASVIRRLMEPVEVSTARITERGEEGGDAESTFWAAYILAFIAYFIIAMYGHSVMRSVIQEKVTRISEILVSTVRAGHLMAGKIAGVSGAALLQLAIWAALVALAASQSALLQDRLGVSEAAIEAMRVPPGILALLLLFLVLGFLLFAALFAALGAAMSSEQEAQPFQMVLMVPLFVPLLFLGAITNDPEGGIARFLGLFPLTAPVAMPMRLGAAPPDAAVVALSLGLLVLSTIALAWLAGKIYRIGILATGKRPGVRELARWVRAA